jgi:deaminated glutathione amidase
MRVALCQMSSGEDVEGNRADAEALVSAAAHGGADLAALPEVFPYRGPSRRHREIAEVVPGPTSDLLSSLARRHRLWVLGGSIVERDGPRVFNTSLLFDRSGEQVARYRKIHMFDVDLPDVAPVRESATFSAGEEIVTAETEFGRVGLSICYDVRFPELYRALAARGSELLFVPSNFQRTTGLAHWEVLLRARAIENQAFVVAPAQWGAWGDPSKARCAFGHSLVADPWGRIVVRAAEEGTGVAFADLDFHELRRVRSVLPALAHRRLGPAS